MYVWAVEQRQRFEKQDVFVLWSPSPPSCSCGDPCARWVQKPILQEFFRKLASNQPCLKLDGTLELHREARRGEEKMSCTAREKFLRWCWFSRWLDSGWLISGTKKRSLDTAIICFSWVYQTGMRKLKKPLCGFLKHISNFFFYIANKVLKIQQLSKWLLNLCCPHHVASRLSEVAIQN